MENTIIDDILSLILDDNLPLNYRYNLYYLFNCVIDSAKFYK